MSFGSSSLMLPIKCPVYFFILSHITDMAYPREKAGTETRPPAQALTRGQYHYSTGSQGKPVTGLHGSGTGTELKKHFSSKCNLEVPMRFASQ